MDLCLIINIRYGLGLWHGATCFFKLQVETMHFGLIDVRVEHCVLLSLQIRHFGFGAQTQRCD